MPAKPLIGLNADFRSAKKDSPAFSFVAAGYYDAIIAAGGIPVILPPLDCDESIEQCLDLLSGFVLVGGADLDPRRDGYMVHPSMRLLDARREDFDRLLMRKLSDRRLPTFGIGAGMQLLNVNEGGTLYFHIPEDLPKALPHKDLLDAQHRHSLEVAPRSLMDRVFGEGEIRVNSMHHMSIDDVAPGFRVTARCPDGVVEAIESTRGDWFALGVQFHPESESATALDRRIFEEFIDGAVAAMQGAPALRMVG
jgi:putative glutamine amidotransferase